MQEIKNILLSGARGLIFGILAIGAATAFAWTASPANPPSNNAPAPINVSAAAQTKAGSLTLTSPLYVNNTVRATRYNDDDTKYYADLGSYTNLGGTLCLNGKCVTTLGGAAAIDYSSGIWLQSPKGQGWTWRECPAGYVMTGGYVAAPSDQWGLICRRLLTQ